MLPSFRKCLFVTTAAVGVLLVPSVVHGRVPQETHPKDIAEIFLAIDGQPSLDRLLPGRTVPVNVVIKDKKGKTYSAADLYACHAGSSNRYDLDDVRPGHAHTDG